MMYNVLVTGSNGQLGRELQSLSSHYEYSFFFRSRESLDIKEYAEVEQFVKKNAISIIVNTAAYTAVDKAEEQQDLADAINHLAVANFAQMAKEKNIKTISETTFWDKVGNLISNAYITC